MLMIRLQDSSTEGGQSGTSASRHLMLLQKFSSVKREQFAPLLFCTSALLLFIFRVEPENYLTALFTGH